MPLSAHLSPIEAIIEDARQGRMVVLVDDEDRENEGDLVIPAAHATPEAVNFMAKHGRGLVCLSLTRERIEALELPFMSRQNGTRHQTAFTVSIEAREGVTTGISAADRARTIAVAIDPERSKYDIVTPGHVFPLMARDGGVLVRAGHTEAAVDIARLAGLNPSGVICEIMNDDGTMARLPELIAFAKTHEIKIATIADLIAYRRRYDKIVSRSIETTFDSVYGGAWKMLIYVNTVSYAEHVALVKGDLAAPGGGPPLVRVHALNILNDVLGDRESGRGGELHAAMRLIAREGRGAVVLIREPMPTSLSDRIRSRDGVAPSRELRDYGVGAQILLDLGIKDMILLSNSRRTIVGLADGYGLSVVERRPIPLEKED
ncbi:MAG: 3,4-dihydroxy-2-butanone-4-phosphate synthase [Rhodospirillales bacterium]|nr:3,4-dihydroxy-2-butanone-4-phosphate synthase [Rhodospirillales bacterium]